MRRGYISRVEHGHTVPCLETLQRFAAALDVPMYRLFYTAQDEPPAVAAAASLPATLEELAQGTGTESAEARFLLQLKPLIGKFAESDRAFLLDCARKLAAHGEALARSESGRLTKLKELGKNRALCSPMHEEAPK